MSLSTIPTNPQDPAPAGRIGDGSRAFSRIELDRRDFRRRQRSRSILLSIVSTLVFAVVIGVVIVNSPGWERVQTTFFNLETAVTSFPAILKGLWLNIQVLFVAAIGVASLLASRRVRS